MKSVIIQNGNKEVNVKVIGSNVWEKDSRKRVYFDLDQDKKRVIFSKFFEVIAGEAKDSMAVFFEVNGRKFGYVGGMLNSNTKREAAFEGAKELAAKL